MIKLYTNWGDSQDLFMFFLGVVWGTMVDNHYIYMKKLESVTLMMTRGDSPIFTEIPLTAEASLFLFTSLKHPQPNWQWLVCVD